jgi:NADH-quinone oxidoreductase subunit C
MDAASRLAVLRELLPDVVLTEVAAVDQPCILVPSEAIARVAHLLRTDSALQFHVLAELTAADYWPAEPRFEVVYHFVCLGAAAYGDPSAPPPARLRVKARVHGESAWIPSICATYPNADWYEREVYDLFGIEFDGHPNLSRILMPDDWEGHPARKDYPVQIRKPVDIGMPLEMTEDEFVRSVERQRAVLSDRGPSH